MKSQYHYFGESSGIHQKIIKDYNLPKELNEVISIIVAEEGYKKSGEHNQNKSDDKIATIVMNLHTKKSASLDTLNAATIYLSGDIKDIKTNDFAWMAKLVMIFSDAIAIRDHTLSHNTGDKIRDFFERYIYKGKDIILIGDDKQVALVNKEKSYSSFFEIAFIPTEYREQKIYQDFCKHLFDFYVLTYY